MALLWPGKVTPQGARWGIVRRTRNNSRSPESGENGAVLCASVNRGAPSEQEKNKTEKHEGKRGRTSSSFFGIPSSSISHFQKQTQKVLSFCLSCLSPLFVYSYVIPLFVRLLVFFVAISFFVWPQVGRIGEMKTFINVYITYTENPEEKYQRQTRKRDREREEERGGRGGR